MPSPVTLDRPDLVVAARGERAQLEHQIDDIKVAIEDLEAEDRRAEAERVEQIRALERKAAYLEAVLEMLDDRGPAA